MTLKHTLLCAAMAINFVACSQNDIHAEGLPSAVAAAEELAVLPEGRWLVLESRALVLVGRDGRERARVAIRGEFLDTRSLGDATRVVVFDEDAHAPRVLRVTGDRIVADTAPPAPAFAVETQCLYRDAQGHDHLFLIGKDGGAEQWLLGDAPRLLRRLSLPPEAADCAVDDARATLYVSEAGFGVWAYGADGEGVPQRRIVAALDPIGPLERGAGRLAVVAQGVAVADEAESIHLMLGQDPPSRFGGVRGKRLAVWGERLLVRGEKEWSVHGLPTPAQTLTDPPAPLPIVMARVQTESVGSFGDAADDPAIWLHPGDPAQSRVLGTNKKRGLYVYDLDGRQLQFLDAGRLNNVDVRQGVRLGGRTVDLAVATRRDDASLALFEINPDGMLIAAGHVATRLGDVYGTCLYHPPGGGLEAIVNDKDGRFQQWRILPDGKGWRGQLVREFRTQTQPEGCVVDDRNGRLFYGEERHGIWARAVDADAIDEPQLVLAVGELLVADVEGLALYRGERASYLVASSQGNSSYLVIDALPPYRVRGAFRIGINITAGIDGTSDTDGLEVSAVDFGGSFREGMLVVQDGYKRLPDGAQNYKYVAWQDIKQALGLE